MCMASILTTREAIKMRLDLLQEVYFDICDAIENGNLYDVKIDGFQEFNTVLEFLKEQKSKLENLEASTIEGGN